MRTPKIIKREYIKQLESILNLQNHWDDEVPSAAGMTLGLSTLLQRVGQGYYIVRQKFNVYSPLRYDEEVYIESDIVLKKSIGKTKYLACKVNICRGHVILELLTELLKKENEGKIHLGYSSREDGEFLKKITPSQIYAFSNWSGDINTIHLTEKPVAQGMLILMLIEDYLKSKNQVIKRGHIRYIKPVMGGDRVYVCLKESKELEGHVNGDTCFILKYSN